jgi:Uma2 family endonuclease
MPTAVTETSIHRNSLRKRWTRAEYEALSSVELLNQQRLELVEGELINKMGKGRPHVNALVLLLRSLTRVFGDLRVVPESPIDVSSEDNPTSEPEPDLIVLTRDITQFPKHNPKPEDLQMVIEIADSGLYFDLTTKAGLYARAGITEYWVLDTASRRMIVHRDPRDGRYTSTLAYGADESIAPLAAPDSAFRVGDAFPQ